MKLDKRHLVAALALLVSSIVYNVWVFTRPADGPTNVPVAPLAGAASVTADPLATPAPLDPTQVPPLPEVELDRLPDWGRNPFVNLRTPEPAPQAAVAVVADATLLPDADPVISTILYSSDRRLAMVDNRIVRVGDRLADATIVDILPDAVVIESPARGRRVLTVRPPGIGAGAR